MKSLFRSKTFWFNVLVCTEHLVGYLPADVVVPITAITNVLLRMLTTEPVKVL